MGKLLHIPLRYQSLGFEAALTFGRFWSKVDIGVCWEWTRCRDAGGYGRFGFGTTVYLAHRVAWEMLVGAIPDDLDLDHLCRNHACVNPDHLEPVTRGVNLDRGIGRRITKARHAAVVSCPRGHDYDEANTYWFPDGRTRHCRACKRDDARDRRAGLRTRAEVA